jgi:RNA polymerase sigma factor for flagellar operon FliA
MSPVVTPVATFAELLSQHRHHVRQVVHDTARRHHLSLDELSEFSALVDRELERNGYQVLREFEGRSTWETYLTIVIRRLFFEFQAELWGNWRPSAEAMRLGPTAVLLEELVDRDRMELSEAILVMQRTHRVDAPAHRLEELYRALQDARRAAAAAAGAAAPEGADARKRAIERALQEALTLLAPDDRLVIALRYRDREPITRIARLLGDDPRPVQRRLERAKDVIRNSLSMQDITPDEINAVLENADQDADARGPHKKWWQIVLSRPSNH